MTSPEGERDEHLLSVGKELLKRSPQIRTIICNGTIRIFLFVCIKYHMSLLRERMFPFAAGLPTPRLKVLGAISFASELLVVLLGR